MRRAVALEHIAPTRRIFPRSRLAISERRLLLVAGDLLLISGSIIGSLLLWARWADRIVTWARWQEQGLWSLFILGAWILWLLLGRLYDLRRTAVIGWNARRLLWGGVIIALAYLVLFFLTSPVKEPAVPPLPRLAPGMAIISSMLLLLLWRTTYALVLSGPQFRRRVLIVGAGTAGVTVCQTILRHHSSHYHVLGFIDDDPVKHMRLIERTPVLGGHDRLSSIAQDYHADEIVVAISAEVRGSLFQSIMDCHERGMAITPMPLLYERLTGKIAVEHIGSQWYIALPLHQHAATHVFYFLKRLGDIVFGLLGCLLFAASFPLIALAIRLDTPGPIFYEQQRAGSTGRPFRVRKFRSMIQDAEKNGLPQWAIKDDDRITSVGRFLRKTRLDELPQMLNILRGEMSLVGPRPERPEFIEQLQDQIPFYRTRLAVKPGLTGWAQINYGYGSTIDDALIKLQYDLYYIKHQSPWLDALIMLRTIGVVLKMKGQ